MTTKAKVIAGVVGGVLIVGGIGSAFNKGDNEDSNSSDISSSISQSVSGFDSEPENSEDNSKVYTIDEFCKRFENENDFAHEHKDQTFTISGIIDRISYKSVYFESDVKSEKWKSNYKIEFMFEDKETLKPLDADMQATISGEMYSFATSSITLKNCTLIAYEKSEDNSTISENTSSTTADEISDSSSSETSSTDESTQPIESSTESSSSFESELQSTVQENESTASVPENTTVPIQSTSQSESSAIQQKSYVLNTSTKKVHKPSCRDVDKIDYDNLGSATSEELDSYIQAGYTACGHCHPF